VLATVLLLAFSVRPLRTLSASAVAATASTILTWCWQLPVEWSLTDGSDIALAIPAHDGWESGTLEVRTLLFVRNMPLLVAMALAMGWPSGRRLVAIVGGGLFALALLDGVVVAYMAWETLAAGVRPASVAFEVLALLSLYNETGGMFVAPVFIVAFIAAAAVSRSARPSPLQ
jgi:hypothetical protein